MGRREVAIRNVCLSETVLSQALCSNMFVQYVTSSSDNPVKYRMLAFTDEHLNL